MPAPVWTGEENLAPSGIRSPDRPVRSESLNRLSYPGPYTRCSADSDSHRHAVPYETLNLEEPLAILDTRLHVSFWGGG